MLAPGEEVIFTGRGRVVVEALRTATVRLQIRTTARAKARALFPLERSPVGLLP
jgi:hypothetical protein